ncbi:MAG: RagB/SusD family nutrient uptake outer membrane protein [Chitinophagaceae bacterium]|nr:RagB/SusD family nutrient uptake outer membrane protein [Chitinophagaceae bacterium]
MNLIYKCMIGCYLVLSATGCSKYLEEKSQDEVKPGSVSELQQLLMGEVYPAGQRDGALAKSSFHFYLDLMTDDMVSGFNPSNASLGIYNSYEGPFTWKADMFESMDAAGVAQTDTYAHYYRRIMGCNVVLDMIDKVKGDDGERENVRGQALAMRSYFYFMLVNLFAQPYNAPGIDRATAPGVELILTSTVKDDFPKRASMAAVYEQIETDLLKALPMVNEHSTQNTRFRVTPAFVKCLLSRLYLYQEKWDLAVKYASDALANNPALLKLSDIPFPLPYYQQNTGIYSINSPEVIWFGYADNQEYFGLSAFEWDKPIYFSISPDLRSRYEYNQSNSSNRGDLRMRYYYYWDYSDYNWTIFVPIMGQKAAVSNSGVVKGMRVAELYLNRAEANIQLYLKNGDDALRLSALNDLNRLRQSRYDTRNVAYVPVDLSGQDLLDFCHDERRRELSFEDHRWFDLRRYGMPEIKHTFRKLQSQPATEFVLHKNDKRYVLPLPRTALVRNPNLEQNP